LVSCRAYETAVVINITARMTMIQSLFLRIIFLPPIFWV